MNIQGQSTAKNGLSLSKSGSAYKTGSCYANEQTIGPSGGHSHDVDTPLPTGTTLLQTLVMTNGFISGQITSTSPQLGLTSLAGSTTTDGSHSHTFTPSITDNIGVSDNISFSLSGDTETRPSNYTYIIWKRVS